jgi:Zn-dependent protease with chaperone function
VALPAEDCPSFEEATALIGPRDELWRVDVPHGAASSKSRTLPICEKPFIAWRNVTAPHKEPGLSCTSLRLSGGGWKKHLPPVRYSARLAICSTGLLFCVLRVGASDTAAPDVSKAAEQTSISASSKSQTAPGTEEKIGKSGKYDVDRIGQRSIGKGVNLYSLEKERALGKAMADSIDEHTRFITDPDINDYINRLAQKIARNSDAQVPFTIKVIDCLDLRIFALPGGFLYVDTGLIMEVDSEAELAGLMAREIAHVAARHATRFATRKYAWNMISFPLIYLGGPAGLGTKQIGPLALKKFSRDAEMEADLLGIEYQYAAGYDPQAFVDVLEKLHSKETQMRARMAAPKAGFVSQIVRAFATYPPTEERIQKAQTEISTLLPSRGDYVVDTNEFQEVKAKLAGTDRPILRRHRPGDGVPNAPVLHRRPSEPPPELAPYRQGASVAGLNPPAR